MKERKKRRRKHKHTHSHTNLKNLKMIELVIRIQLGQKFSKHLRTSNSPESDHYNVPFSLRHSQIPRTLQQYSLHSEVSADGPSEYSIKHVLRPQLDFLFHVINAIFEANTKYKENPVVNTVILFH